MKNTMKPICILLLLLSVCPIAAHAQNAEVGGAVYDPSGTVVAKASVGFRNQNTGIRWQTVTNHNGLYRIGEIDPGKYDATVQARGFKTITSENVVIQTGRESQIDFKMQVRVIPHSSPRRVLFGPLSRHTFWQWPRVRRMWPANAHSQSKARMSMECNALLQLN